MYTETGIITVHRKKISIQCNDCYNMDISHKAKLNRIPIKEYEANRQSSKEIDKSKNTVNTFSLEDV